MRPADKAFVAACVVVTLGALAIGAWRERRDDQARLAAESATADRVHRTRIESAQRQREKSVEQIVAEARARDAEAARLAATVAAEQEARRAQEERAESCRGAIRARMPHLEPAGEPDERGDERRYTVRLAVRLADSFRAAPIGIVECSMDAAMRLVTVQKVPM